MWPRITAIILACLSGPMLPSSASAQGSPNYSEAMDIAVEQIERGHWSEARAAYLAAHTIQPNARTWNGLGATAFELRAYEEAIIELEHAVVDKREPLTAAQRSHAEGLIRRARLFLGHSPASETAQGNGDPAVAAGPTERRRKPLSPLLFLIGAGVTTVFVVASVVTSLEVNSSADAEYIAATERVMDCDGDLKCGLVMQQELFEQAEQRRNDALDSNDSQNLAFLLWLATGGVAAGTAVVGIFFTDWSGDDDDEQVSFRVGATPGGMIGMLAGRF